MNGKKILRKGSLFCVLAFLVCAGVAGLFVADDAAAGLRCPGVRHQSSRRRTGGSALYQTVSAPLVSRFS